MTEINQARRWRPFAKVAYRHSHCPSISSLPESEKNGVNSPDETFLSLKGGYDENRLYL